jgi:hypothetical protein
MNSATITMFRTDTQTAPCVSQPVVSGVAQLGNSLHSRALSRDTGCSSTSIHEAMHVSHEAHSRRSVFAKDEFFGFLQPCFGAS